MSELDLDALECVLDDGMLLNEDQSDALIQELRACRAERDEAERRWGLCMGARLRAHGRANAAEARIAAALEIHEIYHGTCSHCEYVEEGPRPCATVHALTGGDQ